MSPVVHTGVKTMTITMRHLKTTPDSRDASSSESDIDRQELIDNYGSEKYLSKWSLDVDPDGDPSKDVVYEHNQSEKLLDDKGLHCLSVDDDASSLVSYNSVRDAGIPDKQSTVPHTSSSLPYHIQTPTQQITLWQGYSGNLYFDPVRCQSMRINSSKPHKRQKPKVISNWSKTESGSPPVDILTTKQYSLFSASSFHSIGSLRIASRDEKRKKTASLPHYGKLYKRFADSKVKEYSLGHRRCESAPDSLVVAGGQVKDSISDSIDHGHVLKHNAKTRRLSRSKDSFPTLVVGHKWGIEKGKPYNQLGSSLPPVDSLPPSKGMAAEPKSVFIIPFGALDDPVEGDNSNGEISKTNKQKLKATDVIKQGDINDSNSKDPLLSCSKDRKTLLIPDTTEQPTEVSVVGYNVNDINLPRNTKDIQVRCEISNSSLSNYLRAIPTKLLNNTPDQQNKVPILSYTKRSRDSIPGSLVMNSDDMSRDVGSLRISSTRALYGGYLPSTPAKASHTEVSSASQTSETDSIISRDERESHMTFNHQRPVKRNSNKNIHLKHPQQSNKCHLPVIGWHVS